MIDNRQRSRSDTDSRKVAVARDIALLRAVASAQHAVTRRPDGSPGHRARGGSFSETDAQAGRRQMIGALVDQSSAERCPVLGAYLVLIADMPAEESATWTAFVLKSEAQ